MSQTPVNQNTNRKGPTVAQLQAELSRENYRSRFGRVLWTTIFALVVVAAATVLIAVLWLPILEIYGSSMSPTLEENEIVASVKVKELERGDIVAFYYGNKLLVKRVIGLPEDTVEIMANGTVVVNNAPIAEPYLTEKALGDSDIEYPFTVPVEQYFVLGDRRSTSLDSRNSAVGCVSLDAITGKVVFRVWPLNKFGRIGTD